MTEGHTSGAGASYGWRTWLIAGAALAAGAAAAVLVAARFFDLREEAPLALLARGRKEAAPALATMVGSTEKGSRPRAARKPQQPPPSLEQLTQMYDWPAEPVAPTGVEDARLTAAMVLLCGPTADLEVGAWYAGWVSSYARTFGADAFLLGALVAYRSGCRRVSTGTGVGLTGLVPELYAQSVIDGRYHYDVFADGGWSPRSLDVSRFPFERGFWTAPESNIYFAAAFLRAFQEQQRGLFVSFVQHEYRHYVSHFIWGDIVGSNRQEDAVLVLRRRLLEYYGERAAAGPVQFEGMQLGCPLDGCPRVITSTLGDSREGGKRAHRGVDFESIEGEPVRAVADGKVEFAGADLPGKAAHAHLPIYAQASVSKSLFGAGGIYVCIRHAAMMSCYMHLQSAKVEQGRTVRRGDLIGSVGRTGIQSSPPHLHFEIHMNGQVLPATDVMPTLVLGRPRNTPIPAQAGTTHN